MDGRPTDAAPGMLPYRLPATADDSAHGQVASNHACEAVLSLAALEHNSTPPHTMRAHDDLNADQQAAARMQPTHHAAVSLRDMYAAHRPREPRTRSGDTSKKCRPNTKHRAARQRASASSTSPQQPAQQSTQQSTQQQVPQGQPQRRLQQQAAEDAAAAEFAAMLEQVADEPALAQWPQEDAFSSAIDEGERDAADEGQPAAAGKKKRRSSQKSGAARQYDARGRANDADDGNH